MKANTEKITFRLTPDQVENLDSIMLDRDIKSRSQVIRMAIENFISENLKNVTSQKVILHLPNNTVNKLVDFVSAGDALSVESAIQLSVAQYISSIEDYYLNKRKQLQNARLEYQKEQAEKLSLRENMKR